MNVDDSSPNQAFSPRALIHAAIQRLSAQSASCKLWSVILSSVVLLFAAGRAGGETLLWAAAPILLLAVADGVYAARVQALREASLKPNGKGTGHELMSAVFAAGSFADVARSFVGITVLPFYLLLAVIVAGLGVGVVVPKAKPAAPTFTAGPAFPPSTQGMPPMGMPPSMSPTGSTAPRPQSSGTMPSNPAGTGAFPSRPGLPVAPGGTPSAPAGAQSGQGAPPSSFMLNRNQIPPQNSGTPRPPVLTPPGANVSGAGKSAGGEKSTSAN